ncbi:hypothetical protein F4811DRAFT_568493 [Daldinia bambusicola]|nr:hypothetical protein F4811DRAFT_568493 [Daldinia bambusicola]
MSKIKSKLKPLELQADTVIWGLVYRDTYKDDVQSKDLNQLHKEAVDTKKMPQKAAKKENDDESDGVDDVNKDENDDGNDGNCPPNPSSTNNTSGLLPGEALSRAIVVQEGQFVTGLLCADGSRINVNAGQPGRYKLILGSAGRYIAPDRYQQRTSLVRDIYWDMVSITGQSYAEASDREDVAPRMMGPAKASRPIECNLDRDVFIIDRSALACIDRPREGGGASEDATSARAKKARTRVEEWPLRPRNLAFNINDPASLYLYTYFMEKAARHGDAEVKALLKKKKTVTFFSGPEVCNHEDCEAWRDQQNTKMRPPATKKVLGYSWWAFADFCPLHTSENSFAVWPHSKDPIQIKRVTSETAKSLRVWAHAMLNHSYMADGYKVSRVRQTAPTLNALVRTRGNCLLANHLRVDGGQIDLVATQIAGGGPCYVCGEQHPQAKRFGQLAIDKHQVTGLIYLHYGSDEDKDVAAKAKVDDSTNSSSEGSRGGVGEGIDEDESSGCDHDEGEVQGESSTAALRRAEAEAQAEGEDSDADFGNEEVSSDDEATRKDKKGKGKAKATPKKDQGRKGGVKKTSAKKGRKAEGKGTRAVSISSDDDDEDIPNVAPIRKKR